MYMNWIGLFWVCLIFISACSTNAVRGGVSLYDEFQSFGKEVQKDYDGAVQENISTAFIAFYQQAEDNMPPEIRTPFYKDLAMTIRTEYNHFEVVQGDEGCLTINGLDQDEQPKTLSLYYIRQGGHWVIDNIHVHGHDSIKEYYTSVSCPKPG